MRHLRRALLAVIAVASAGALLTLTLGTASASPTSNPSHATHTVSAQVPRISPTSGACGSLQLTNGIGELVTDNGLDQVLTLGGGGNFCWESTGSGLWKLHVHSNMSHCITRTSGVLIINGCVQGQSAQQFAVGAPDDRGDWGGNNCCINYTNFDTAGSELFYSASGGSWDNWHFTQTNKRTTAKTTAAVSGPKISLPPTSRKIKGTHVLQSFGPYYICLTNAPTSKCLTSHGAGNQMTIQGSGSSWAKLTLISVFGEYVMQDANGNCVRVMNSPPYAVNITGGNCRTDGGDPDETWTETGNNTSGFLYNNPITGGYLGTTNDNNGNNVWALNNCCSNWYHWTLSNA